jgi:copper chaperone NosL
MVISDPRFGAKVVTSHGKTITFDSVECLASYALTNDTSAIRSMWVSDFQHPGTFVRAEDARFLQGGTVQSPMGLGLTAFSSEMDARGLLRVSGGETLDWLAMLALVRHERLLREDDSDGERVLLEHRPGAAVGEAIATAR